MSITQISTEKKFGILFRYNFLDTIDGVND